MPFPLLSQVHDSPLSLANATGGEAIRPPPSGSSLPSFTVVRHRSPPSLVAFVRLARWRRRGHLAPPLFVLVRPLFALAASLARDEEGRLSPAASGSGFSRLSRAFIFVSGLSFSHFSRVPADVLPPSPRCTMWPLSLANTTWGSIRSPPSDSPFPCSPPSLVAFVCPACASVAGDEEGVWPHPPSHPRSPSFPPSFVLVRPRSPRSLATNWVASPPLACKHEWGVDLAAACPSPLVRFFSFSHFSLTKTTS
jgi:hypothetical protein